MLLYIGAGTDIRPVTRYAHVHKDFIYVDALPHKFKDYGVEREHIQATLVRDLQREDAFEKLDILDDDTFVIKLRGGSRILYFLNVLDSDVHRNPKVAPYYREADALYMHGFTPKLQERPPNVQTIFGTYISFRKVRRQAWFQMQEFPKLVEIPQYESPDISHVDTPALVTDTQYFIRCKHCLEYNNVILNWSLSTYKK